MGAVAKPSSLPGTVASARSPRGCVQPPASSPLASQRVCLGACPVEGLALPHSLQFRVPFSSASLRSEFSLTTCHTLMVNLKTSAGFSTRIKQPTHRPRVAAPAPSHPLPCGVHAATGRALAIGAHCPSLATSPRPECGPQRCGTWSLEPKLTRHLEAGCRRPGVRSQTDSRPLAPKSPQAASALSFTFSHGLAIRSSFW